VLHFVSATETTYSEYCATFSAPSPELATSCEEEMDVTMQDVAVIGAGDDNGKRRSSVASRARRSRQSFESVRSNQMTCEEARAAVASRTSRRGRTSMDAVANIHIDELERVEGVPRSCFEHFIDGILFVCVPLSGALRAVGVKYAGDNSETKHSIIAPLMLASLLLASVWCMLLVAVGGIQEVRKLCDRKYIWLGAVPSLFSSGALACENSFITLGGSPTMLLLIMNCDVMPGILGEFAMTRVVPFMTQVLTVFAIILAIGSYSFVDGELSTSVVCLMLGMGACMCDAADGFSFEVMSYILTVGEEVCANAEYLRYLLVTQLYETSFLFVFILMFEFEYFQNDLLTGFNAYVVLAVICPTALMIGSNNASIIKKGMVRTTVAGSLDVAAGYILEIIIFRRHVKVVDSMQLGVITLLVLIYISFAIDLRRQAALNLLDQLEEERNVSRCSMASSLGRRDQSITEDVNSEAHEQMQGESVRLQGHVLHV